MILARLVRGSRSSDASPLSYGSRRSALSIVICRGNRQPKLTRTALSSPRK